MLNGDVNPHDFTEDKINAPRLMEARKKVSVVLHPDWSREIMEVPVSVSIRLKNSKEFSGTRKYAIGSPPEPLTMEQFRGLYNKFTEGILPSQLIKKSADAIMNLENCNDMNEIMDMIAVK